MLRMLYNLEISREILWTNVSIIYLKVQKLDIMTLYHNR